MVKICTAIRTLNVDGFGGQERHNPFRGLVSSSDMVTHNYL